MMSFIKKWKKKLLLSTSLESLKVLLFFLGNSFPFEYVINVRKSKLSSTRENICGKIKPFFQNAKQGEWDDHKECWFLWFYCRSNMKLLILLFIEETLNLSPIQGLYAMNIPTFFPFSSYFSENLHNFPSLHSI